MRIETPEAMALLGARIAAELRAGDLPVAEQLGMTLRDPAATDQGHPQHLRNSAS